MSQDFSPGETAAAGADYLAKLFPAFVPIGLANLSDRLGNMGVPRRSWPSRAGIASTP